MNKYLQKHSEVKQLTLKSNTMKAIRELLPKYAFDIKIKDLGVKNKFHIKEVSYSYYYDIAYDKLVNALVKERYSDSEEYSILRKAILNITDEFNVYNEYVENCKKIAKAFIEKRESVL